MRVQLLVLCAVMLPLPGLASTATLRPDAMLTQPVVHLSDLFENAGPESTRILGPAPSPGSRFTVEAAQLAAIARQYRVDWQPLAGAERVVVERAGRMLPQELVVAALEKAVHEHGAPRDVEIEIANFSTPMVATDTQPSATVERFDYDAPAGRFTATLLIGGGALDEQRIRVAGRATEMAEIMVPARRLAAGSVIRPEDLHTARVRMSALHETVAQAQDQLIGRSLRRAASVGQPVPLADLARPSDVAKGAHVAMELAAPGLSVSAVGVALESGSIGEYIHVLNPGSRAVLEAEITGATTVRVDPDSRPSMPGRETRPLDFAGRRTATGSTARLTTALSVTVSAPTPADVR